ncbi:hypothetical protein KBH77_01365 [Patescibacteria group bacterium]|nr:hypothetical protein [Patescibacteria group bacterium]
MENKNKNQKEEEIKEVKIENDEEKDSTFFIKIDKNNKEITNQLAKEMADIIDLYAEGLSIEERNGE